jgi:predicted outer membrane repeat protein
VLLRNQKTTSGTKRPSLPRKPARFRPGLEVLEDRTVPAVLNVTTPLDVVDPNDGVLSLREAVQQANASKGPDTIFLPAGTYLLNGGDELAVTDDTNVTGAGAGATVIDGGGEHRVFHLIGAQQVTLSGVTIQGGVENSSGGGILSEGSDLTIDHSTIAGNAAFLGAGIEAYGGTVTVAQSTISGNSATGGGGIAAQEGAMVTVKGSEITGNFAWGGGGGIYADSVATVTVKDSTLSGNSAFYGGGGISGSVYSLTVDHSTISGNTTVYGVGGGISGDDFISMSVDHSTIAGNTAMDSGGGVFIDFTTAATIKDSTITGNSAGRSGGGIFVEGVTLTVQDCTISGNSATSGGGLYVADSPFGPGSTLVTVEHSTVSGNTAVEGGGLYAQSSTMEVDQSTLNDADGGGIFNDHSTIHLKKSVVDGVFYNDQDYV